MNFGQDEGPVWYAELEWGIEYDTEGNPQPAGDNYRPETVFLKCKDALITT